MRSTCVKILALSVLATVASTKSVGEILKGFFKGPQKIDETKSTAAQWPKVNWPVDFHMAGSFFQWDAQSSTLSPYMNMTDDIYLDADGNREKVLTYLDVANLGKMKIITYIDGQDLKMYTNIPDIGQCTVQNLPADFNLTTMQQLAADPNSGVTNYVGEQPVPWAGNELFYTFHIVEGDVDETVYFCKKTLNLKWVTMAGKPFIIKTDGQQEQHFTDADFQNLKCTPSSNNGMAILSFNHPVHKRLVAKKF
eukprot:403373631